jgi:hypothetical protein
MRVGIFLDQQSGDEIAAEDKKEIDPEKSSVKPAVTAMADDDRHDGHGPDAIIGVTGFEPATSWSQTRRSTKLSYTP